MIRIKFFFILTWYSNWFLFRPISDNTDKKAVSNSITPGAPIAATGYAVDSATSPFKLFHFERRVPRPNDVLIRIHYCGNFYLKNNNKYFDIEITEHDFLIHSI